MNRKEERTMKGLDNQPQSWQSPDMAKTTVPALQCTNPRCGHVWVPKGTMGPRRCPKCWTVVVPR